MPHQWLPIMWCAGLPSCLKAPSTSASAFSLLSFGFFLQHVQLATRMSNNAVKVLECRLGLHWPADGDDTNASMSSSNAMSESEQTLPINKVAEVHAKVYTTVLPCADCAPQTVEAVSIVPGNPTV